MKTFRSTVRRIAPLGLGVASLVLMTTMVHAQSSSDGTLYNPLSSNYGSVQTFIAGALLAMVKIALPLITVAFVYSGFLFISAQGKIEQLSKAKTNFLWTVIGALLILGAWELANLLGGTVTQITNGGGTGKGF